MTQDDSMTGIRTERVGPSPHNTVPRNRVDTSPEPGHDVMTDVMAAEAAEPGDSLSPRPPEELNSLDDVTPGSADKDEVVVH